MLRSLTALAVIAALCAVMARAMRRRPPATIVDDYEDYSTDPYTLSLTGPDGDVELESPFPFFGTVWGQFEPEDD